MTAPATWTPDRVYELATDVCEDCAWYHGFWPLIRALGFGTVPEDHAEFYCEGAREAVRAGSINRVLVCGAADASMPLLMHRIFQSLGSSPEITVLDRCKTPLTLCRAAFGGEAISLKTLHSAVLDAQVTRPFDLIVTHSFLGYFSEGERQALLARWARWLRPRGRVLTVNRVRHTSAQFVGFSEAEAISFVERIVAGVNAKPRVTELSEADLHRLARDYAKRFRIRPLTSIEDVVDQCRAAGLTAEIVPLGRVSRPGPSGPTAPGSADYFGFSLRR